MRKLSNLLERSVNYAILWTGLPETRSNSCIWSEFVKWIKYLAYFHLICKFCSICRWKVQLCDIEANIRLDPESVLESIINKPPINPFIRWLSMQHRKRSENLGFALKVPFAPKVWDLHLNSEHIEKLSEGQGRKKEIYTYVEITYF